MTLETQIQPVTHRTTEHPLSWFQERLWLINRKNPRDLSYNIPVSFLIEGELDTEALTQSLRAIVERHQSLRTRYVTSTSGDAVQVITPTPANLLQTHLHPNGNVAAIVEEHLGHTFDLTDGSVFVARLVRLDPVRHVLLINVHHIAADGWSIEGILFDELQRCYRAFAAKRAPDLRTLPIQYTDFSYWQRQQDFSASLAFWQQCLDGYEDSLEMPTDFLRHAQSGQRSETFVYRYSQSFSGPLEQFSKANGCTLFMCLLAGFGLLVNRYTGKDDLCIGTTTSGRTSPELEGLIGFFINILPLRIRIDDTQSVADFLACIRQSTLAAFDHQQVPFERIVYSLGLERSASSAPLVPLVLRHHNFPRTSLESGLSGSVKFSPYSGDDSGVSAPESASAARTAARCEIELSFKGDGSDLCVEVMYATDLFRRSTIERILRHHQQLLLAMFANPNGKLGDLSPLNEVDYQKLFVQFNQSWRPSPELSTFVARFDVLARGRPNAIACHDRDGAWSYGQIHAAALRIAQTLMTRGVQPGSVVGVCVDRSSSLLSILLGIWKARAAYVPLDPSYPDTYLRQIVADAAPSVTICHAGYRVKLGLSNEDCLTLEQLTKTDNPQSGALPCIEPTPESLAYIMYTSGSTGTPKGVRVPHQQLINWLGGLETNWPFASDEVIAQKTTMAFAVSVKELFAGLLNGCAQVFIEPEVVQNPAALVATLARYRVSRINLVPSHLDAILKHLRSQAITLPDLRYCITAGEPLNAELVQEFRELLPSARLLNNYGCTELNDITYYDTSSFVGTEGFVPIGKPIHNTRLYVLDRQGRLVPEGVAGELHVATAGISDGYHNLAELTEERYFKNPFGSQPSDRLYNTGDVVRFLPSGDLEYIGRWDMQVKVRGFRVDVRQVEKVLGEYPGIGLRAVVGEGQQLQAYFVPKSGQLVDGGQLRAFLQERLPDYMIPNVLVALPEMPRLPNGKVNRRALRPTLGHVQHASEFQAPASELEGVLASIWSEVLQVPEDEIGRQTHFFEVGGHSLAATRVVARIKDRLSAEIGLSEFFEHARLDRLAEYVSNARRQAGVGDDAEPEWQLTPATGTDRRRAPGLLDDKVVLVTGSSRGIGSAAVRLLARQGAQIAINYVQNEMRATHVRDLIQQDGGTAEIFQGDVTDAGQVEQMVDAVRQRFGRIDVLVANAAIGFKIQPFVDYDWTDFERKLCDEIKSMFHLCQAVVPDMIARKSGSIVAVSSSMSRVANNGYVSHCTAKAALDSFVRTLAGELGPSGIRINTVAPGLTLTDATALVPHQQRDAAATRCPLRRNGLPRDVAGAILFLASDLSEFMTGAYLPVDGGMTMI